MQDSTPHCNTIYLVHFCRSLSSSTTCTMQPNLMCLSGTSVSNLRFPARSTCQIRTLGRRMATRPNWTKRSVLSYYMRRIADLWSMSPREAHDVSRGKTKLNQISCLYRGPVCRICDSPHVVRARWGHSGGAWQQNQTEPNAKLSRTTCGESQIYDLCLSLQNSVSFLRFPTHSTRVCFYPWFCPSWLLYQEM